MLDRCVADVLRLLLHAVERRDHRGVGQRDARGLDALALLVGQVRGQVLRVVRRGVHVRCSERVVQLGQRVQERLPVGPDVLGRLLLRGRGRSAAPRAAPPATRTRSRR